MFFKSFFEVDGPALAPREYADYECARKKLFFYQL